ncbi:MAG: motility protein A [Faecalibacterium sp.]|jgi:chemotaxis protein MotA|nr:motility protein A [Faecalibacterium sp.]
MKRKIDINTLLGLVLGLGCMFLSIIISKDGVTGAYSISVINLGNFIDPMSILIVFGGTIAALMIMFPVSQFTHIPKHLQIILMPHTYEPTKYIETLVECAKKARINGLLALEEDLNAMDDPFMKQSIQMVVDSVDPEKVRTQMESWLDSMDERHAQERAFYDKGAAMGPAFGMVGTLIGLINMMKNLSDTASVGPNMAVALVTTFYGSLLANLIFSPISNKLQVRHEEEYLCLSLVSEGVQAIQAGENPNVIQEKLLRMLPAYKQKKYTGAAGAEGAEDGKKAKGEGKKKK